MLQDFLLQDFIGGAMGILVVLGLSALIALSGYLLLDFDARTPIFSTAPHTDE